MSLYVNIPFLKNSINNPNLLIIIVLNLLGGIGYIINSMLFAIPFDAVNFLLTVVSSFVFAIVFAGLLYLFGLGFQGEESVRDKFLGYMQGISFLWIWVFVFNLIISYLVFSVLGELIQNLARGTITLSQYFEQAVSTAGDLAGMNILLLVLIAVFYIGFFVWEYLLVQEVMRKKVWQNIIAFLVIAVLAGAISSLFSFISIG